jgi:hypothetical protein
MSEANTVLSPPEVDCTADNRRAWVRYPCAQKGVCRAVANSQYGGLWPAKVRDISTSGISLIMSRRFEAGTVLVVELDNTSGDESILLLARVVRVTERRRDDWIMGCTLSKQLSTNELTGLVNYPY